MSKFLIRFKKMLSKREICIWKKKLKDTVKFAAVEGDLGFLMDNYIHSIPRRLIIEIMSAKRRYRIQKISCLPGVNHPKKASVLMIRASRYELQKVVQTLVYL